ncbi:hypothetical protein [Virgibacillus necropolis]|nr:hypothetical protein [Virgibacillus necropolis]
MKKIGMFFSIIALTVLFVSAPVHASSGPQLFSDPGYGDID